MHSLTYLAILLSGPLLLPALVEAGTTVSSADLAITAAEAGALAAILRTVVVPVLKQAPGWDKLPKWARTGAVFLLSASAGALDHYALGKPPLLAALLAVSAAAGAVGAHKAERKRAKAKQSA